MVKEIPLSQGKVALVDDEDFELVYQYKWSVSGRGGIYYARCNINRNGKDTTQSMHRFLLCPPPDKEIDHMNHNGLDNRRCNIKICTHAENMANRSPNKKR